MRVLKIFAIAAALSSYLAGGAALAAATLDGVKSRGVVTCAVNTGLAGFGMPDQQGDYKGLDADTCRAIAAAVLGDAKKVKFIPTTTQQRFTVLQSGEADVLTRNTTDTLLRDTEQGFNFAPVTYYDGQGFMVPAKLGIKSAKELNGATVCVQPGTTTMTGATISVGHFLNDPLGLTIAPNGGGRETFRSTIIVSKVSRIFCASASRVTIGMSMRTGCS